MLVVAYNAATTLAATLDRLPADFASHVGAVLINDDHSADDTFDVATRYRSTSALPITVVRHERNLGYGGNQKHGYRWARENGFDVVVLLHGDGQYAPEAIEDLVGPLARGEADAVFGSRMMRPRDALEGGMPLYKFVGNRVLTTFQNGVTGLRLSEWHSGYRAYRLDALAEIGVERFSDGFDFDTEIILALARAGKRIHEVPIPTYYGDEICYVNGMAYARDVVVDVVRDRLQHRTPRSAVFDDSWGPERPYAVKHRSGTSHATLEEWCAQRPPGSVLDVGCSDGAFGSVLRRHGHRVTGVDVVEHDGVRTRVDEFHRADLNDGLPLAGERFDTIVAADVIEHLVDPGRLLDDLAQRLAPGGRLLVSVPNISHWYPRFKIAAGLFDYDPRGPLDEGHLRFFTRRSLERLVKRHGYEIERRSAVGTPWEVLARPGLAPLVKVASFVDRVLVRVFPRMFGYQLVYMLKRSGDAAADGTALVA